eukprot:1610161-Amphidinium_carterae.1
MMDVLSCITGWGVTPRPEEPFRMRWGHPSEGARAYHAEETFPCVCQKSLSAVYLRHVLSYQYQLVVVSEFIKIINLRQYVYTDGV